MGLPSAPAAWCKHLVRERSHRGRKRVRWNIFLAFLARRAVNGSMKAIAPADRRGSGTPADGTPANTSGQNRVRDPIDQLAEECVGRYRRGERPAVSEYVARYPALGEQIQEVLQALALLEDLAPGRGSNLATRPGSGAPLEQLGE